MDGDEGAVGVTTCGKRHLWFMVRNQLRVELVAKHAMPPITWWRKYQSAKHQKGYTMGFLRRQAPYARGNIHSFGFDRIGTGWMIVR